MIIFDFSQIAIRTMYHYSSIRDSVPNANIEEMIILRIGKIVSNFRKTFGRDVVIAFDDPKGEYWRKDIFEYYKFNRKDARKQSANYIDWEEYFKLVPKIIKAFQTVFPYRAIVLPKVEADDIIAVLCREIRDVPILIVSNDHDFKQLFRYSHVEIYDFDNSNNFKLSSRLTESGAKDFLNLHILKGDKGDGVPNAFTEDSALVEGVRQKSVTKKRIEEFHEGIVPEFFERNKSLVDLTKVPEKFAKAIMEEFDKQDNRVRDNTVIMNYLVKNKFKNALNVLQQF